VLALPVQAEHEIGEEDSLRALAVNLFKLRAMFHRVQQLLLPRHNRNQAKRADSESMACSGSPVYKAGRKAERGSPRGTTGTETTSVACVFLFYVLFFLFSSTSLSLALLPFHLSFAPRSVCLNEPPPWEPLVDDDRLWSVENATTETMDRLKVDW